MPGPCSCRALAAPFHATARPCLPDMDGVRVDTWLETGSEVSPYYDSLLGKLMVYAPTR